MARIIDTLIARFRWDVDQRGPADIERGTQRVQQGLTTTGRNLAMLGAIGAGVTGVVANTLVGFDRAIRGAEAAFGDVSPEKMAELEEQAKLLGRTTERTASEAASAQRELARAGFEVNEVLATTPHVLNLAVAGELDMANAAGITAKALRMFNLDASESERVVDALVHGARSGMTTVFELGESMRMVGPLAHQLGLPLEQTIALLLDLRNTGVEAGMAGTQIRNLLQIIGGAQTDLALKAWKAMGLDIKQLQSQVVNGQIRDAFVDIGNALNAMSKEDAFGALTAIFQRRQSVAATVLSQFTDAASKAQGAMERTAGAGRQVATIMSSGIYGAVKRAASAIEGLWLALGAAGLSSVLEKVLGLVYAFAEFLAEAPEPLQILIIVLMLGTTVLGMLGVALYLAGAAVAAWTTISAGATAAGGRWLIVLRLQQAALTLLNPLTWLSAAATLARAAADRAAAAATWLGVIADRARNTVLWAGVVVQAAWTSGLITRTAVSIAGTAATWAATAAQWALNTAMTANPIGAVIVAIGAVVAAIYVFRDAIWNGLKAAWDWVKRNWPLLLGILLGPVIPLIFAIKKWGGEIKEFFVGIFEAVAGFVGGVIDSIENGFNTLLNSIRNFGRRIGEIVRGILRQAAQIWERHAPGWLRDAVSFGIKVGEGLLGFLGVGGGEERSDPRVYPPVQQRSVSNMTVINNHVDRVDVNTQATDAEGIAGGFRTALDDEFQTARYAYSSGIDR